MSSSDKASSGIGQTATSRRSFVSSLTKLSLLVFLDRRTCFDFTYCISFVHSYHFGTSSEYRYLEATMRLLNVDTLELREFTGSNIPPYCILSHRWGDDEVSYKEFRKGLKKDSDGYRKILGFCKFVRDRQECYQTPWFRYPRRMRKSGRVDWVWIDTCCIDKRSSAELSEAINSMYEWYECALECIVYLNVSSNIAQPEEKVFHTMFKRSDWFRRGWTLQELLAPNLVTFCDEDWQVIGHKRCVPVWWPPSRKEHFPPEHFGVNIVPLLPIFTGVPENYLNGTKEISYASISQRMSWASGRETTRVEDEAYCLLGIFGIHMPLLYGEGRRAFLRLQQEIIRRSTDQSIFVWNAGPADFSVLGDGPRNFERHQSFENEKCLLHSASYNITNSGLEIGTHHVATAQDCGETVLRWTLNYSRNGKDPEYVYLRHEQATASNESYERVSKGAEIYMGLGEKWGELEWKPMEEPVIYVKIESDIVENK